MMLYQPPFTLSNRLMAQVAAIAELVGRWNAGQEAQFVPALRRGNRIKTIQASLAVEQNTLSLEQVTAVLEGKTVLGPPREIQEVRNAFKACEANLVPRRRGVRHDGLAVCQKYSAGRGLQPRPERLCFKPSYKKRFGAGYKPAPAGLVIWRLNENPYQ